MVTVEQVGRVIAVLEFLQAREIFAERLPDARHALIVSHIVAVRAIAGVRRQPIVGFPGPGDVPFIALAISPLGNDENAVARTAMRKGRV